MGKWHRPRRRPAVREAARWVLCFGAAGLIQGYAYLHQLGRALGLGGERPGAVNVRLVSQDRVPPALRHPAEEPGQIADAASQRPAPALREPFGPIDQEEARKLLEEARLVDDPLAMSPETVRERFEAVIRRRSEQGLEDPEQAVAKVKALGGSVSSESANEIADYLGYKNTEYVPRTPAPDGPFQFDDAIIYDLDKVRREKGAPTYRLTLVDRAGRSYSFVLPEGDDPAKYDRLYDIYQAAKANPALMVMVRRMAMPLIVKFTRQADQRRGAAAEQPRPGAAPKPGPPKATTPAPEPANPSPPPRPPAPRPSPRPTPPSEDDW